MENFNAKEIREISLKTVYEKYGKEIEDIEKNILKNAKAGITHHEVRFTFDKKDDITDKINSISSYFRFLGFNISPSGICDDNEYNIDGIDITW